jgi:hypothetical protein
MEDVSMKLLNGLATAGLGTVTSKSGEIWVNLKENYLEKYPE